MTIRIKKVIRTDQWIVFTFVQKLFKRVELKEHNRVITRKIMFQLSLQNVNYFFKIIFGAIL